MSQTAVQAQIPAEITALMAAVRTYASTDPALMQVAGNALSQDLNYIGCVPRTLPSLPTLWSLKGLATPATQILADAIMAAAPHLYWQQSYSVQQVGQDFLDRYGWFNLVAPDGPYLSTSHRVSVGYWDKGLFYPRHWHQPEEIYLVVAGRARFITDGMTDAVLEPGGTRFHPSNVPHAAEMSDSPLLALAIWRGEGLNDISTLEPGVGQ